MPTRRQFIQYTGLAGAGAWAHSKLGWIRRAYGSTQGPGLSDPAMQPKFASPVPNALDPSFIYDTSKGKIKVAVGQSVQYTGLVGTDGITPVPTTVWGYGDKKLYTWPGRTFQVRSYEPLEVKWENRLLDEYDNPLPYLITGKDNTSVGFGDFTGRSVVDTSLHWAYSLHGYEQYSIAQDGVPIVAHVHGAHSDFQFDGNPEFFFNPGWTIRGPQWVEKKYLYDNSQPAGTVWYHDHALGITRLNVYAGMAGFYIIRDDFDTGLPGNPLSLPAFPYEAAFAIQDKMFKDNGELFYPAFPGDPFYADFITDEGAVLPDPPFVGGGPTGLAEFFGDHMVVNGVIWPKMNVEPRNYRLRLLNGCDSRFLAAQFFVGGLTDTDPSSGSGPVPFTVIGSDQGLASSPTTVDTLLMETGSRYDVLFDFKGLAGKRVIMKNIGGDEPFGGDLVTDDANIQVFGDTDRIMAFDVVLPLDPAVPDLSPTGINFGSVIPTPTRLRKVALFEGMDEYGRLQPLLGTVEDDLSAATAYTWFQPATETPTVDTTEVWEIYNFTGDAHPVHLHLVNFEILNRSEISFAADEENPQQVLQHNGEYGTVAAVSDIQIGGDANQGAEYYEAAPKDMVTALPEQVTRIRAHFDKSGRYVWHCHILSHEDHEMMRVLDVD